MNWLAHLHLGGTDPLERLGHLAGDFVRGVDLETLPPVLRRGVLAHREIDAFTDAHPVVRRSRARLEAPLRRFGGVLVDVFLDHVLARRWDAYAADRPPLRRFVDRVHDELGHHADVLPPRLRAIAPRMVAEDWLGSYGTVPGVRRILARMEGRLRRATPLRRAADLLEDDRLARSFEADFEEFYPDVRAFAASLLEKGRCPDARSAPGHGVDIP